MKSCYLIVIFLSLVFGENCNFRYSVPNLNGYACDARGGVPASVEEKVYKLSGQMEGVKLVADSNIAVIRNIKTAIDASKVQQSMAANQLNRLNVQIQDLKLMLSSGHRGKRAIDPNKVLKDAIDAAAIKVANMTNFMQQNGRQQSQLQSTMEARIQQLGHRLQVATAKIARIQHGINTFNGSQSHPTAVVPVTGSSATPAEMARLWDSATKAIAAGNAQKQILNARVSILNNDINLFLAPMVDKTKEISSLSANSTVLKNYVGDLNTDISKYQTEFKKVNTSLTIGTDNLERRTNIMNTRSIKLTTGTASMSARVNKEEKDRIVAEATMKNVEKLITDLASKVNQSLTTLAEIHQNVTLLDANPAIKFEQMEQAAQAELQKEQQLLQGLKMTVGGLQGQVNTMQKNLPVG